MVVEGVDGRGQRFQSAVHDAGDEAAHVRPQAEERILDEAPSDVQQPVQLLQIVTHRFYLAVKHREHRDWGGGVGLSAGCVSPPQNRRPPPNPIPSLTLTPLTT